LLFMTVTVLQHLLRKPGQLSLPDCVISESAMDSQQNPGGKGCRLSLFLFVEIND
jgi:hypothetical protein